MIQTMTTLSPTRRFPCFLLLYFALLGGCGSGSSSAPSESEGRKAVEAMIAKTSDGCIKLLKFDKTNGLAGGLGYRMEFTVEIEFLQDCWFQGGDGMERGYTSFYSEPQKKAKEYYRQVNKRKGEKLRANSYIAFEKTENGWRAEQ